MTCNCDVNCRIFFLYKTHCYINNIRFEINIDSKKQTLCSRGIGLPLFSSSPFPGRKRLLSNSLVSSSTQAGGSRKRSMKSGMRGHDTRGSILGLIVRLDRHRLIPSARRYPLFLFFAVTFSAKSSKERHRVVLGAGCFLGGAGGNNRGKRNCYILISFFCTIFKKTRLTIKRGTSSASKLIS